MKVYVVVDCDGNNDVLAVFTEQNKPLIDNFQEILSLSVVTEEIEVDEESLVRILKKKLKRFKVELQPGGPGGSLRTMITETDVGEYWRGEEVTYRKEYFSIHLIESSRGKAEERAKKILQTHIDSGIINWN